MASLSTAAADRASIDAFRRDVVEASLTTVVIVDFWATWCGPCKTLTPILERAVAATQGRATLVKIDIDKNQALASQFRIQSVPTVYAFIQGQPVDAFQGAKTEREVKAFLDRLLAAVPAGPVGEAAEIEALMVAAGQALDEGAADEAAQMFGAIAAEYPERVDVAAGLARALVALGRAADAEAALVALPADAAKDAGVIRARAMIALAKEAKPVADLAGLKARVAAAPEAHDLAYELAGGQMAVGDRDGAAETLLTMIAADRDWHEAAAKARLLKLFEANGLGDAWTVATRRRLSKLLFA